VCVVGLRVWCFVECVCLCVCVLNRDGTVHGLVTASCKIVNTEFHIRRLFTEMKGG